MCIFGRTNQLYWKKRSKIRPSREHPIETRSYFKKQAAMIYFLSLTKTNCAMKQFQLKTKT